MLPNCIICGVELENFDLSETTVHPIYGTVFRTYGNYGSTIFDPMDASYLDIVICDQCLKDRLHHAYKGVNIDYKSQLDAEQVESEAIAGIEGFEDVLQNFVQSQHRDAELDAIIEANIEKLYES